MSFLGKRKERRKLLGRLTHDQLADLVSGIMETYVPAKYNNTLMCGIRVLVNAKENKPRYSLTQPELKHLRAALADFLKVYDTPEFRELSSAPCVAEELAEHLDHDYIDTEEA